MSLCIVNICDRFKNWIWICLAYLFDLPVMPICIQSHCHLSKKPIVTLLTTATWYLKCANLTRAQCRIHIKMSFLYLIAFISDSEYYYHPPVTWLKTNQIPINVRYSYMKGNTGLHCCCKTRHKLTITPIKCCQPLINHCEKSLHGITSVYLSILLWHYPRN